MTIKKKMALRRVEHAVVVYGTEFLVSLSWGLEVALLALVEVTEVKRGTPDLYAACALVVLVVWPVVTSCLICLAPSDNVPRVTAGVVVLDMFYEAPEHSDHRRVRPDSLVGSCVRLLLQWLGGFIGYAFLLSWFPRVEYHLFAIWNSLGANVNGFVVYGAQIVVNGCAGAMWLHQASEPRGPSRFLSAMQSGTWLAGLLFPWGGPSFSMASYLWVQNGYLLASVVIPMAMCVSALGSALISAVLFEATRKDPGVPVFAKMKKKKNT